MMKIGFLKFENSDDDSSSFSSEHKDEILPINLTYLTPAMEEEARTELNETEETKHKCLAEIRKLIEGDKKLMSPTDEMFLLAFLRARKFNVKRAFKLLQNYWSFRKEYKKIYDCIDDDKIAELILRSFLGLLLHRDKNGCAVLVFKAGLWDPDIDSYENIFLAITAVFIYCLEHPATQVVGFRAIIDLRGVTWKQLKYFTPRNMLPLIRSTQFCYPARFKGIYVLSENKMINFVWSMLNPLLTSKFKKRISFLGEDLSPLTEHIQPSVLPVEFGGQAPCFDNSSWEQILTDKKSAVKDLLNYGYKE